MKLKISHILPAFLFLLGIASDARAQATMNSLDQTADQSQGQYMPMNMGYAGFNSLGMTQSAWLDPLQNLGEGQSKPAYSKYYWSPDLVLPIRVREGMMTLVNFPDWELVEDIFIGDNATFDGQISGPNTLLLYPRKGSNVGLDTNIIVFGRSGNRYVFYVKSEGVNSERLTNSIIDIEVIDNPSGGTNSGGLARGGAGASNGNFTNSGGKSVESTYTRRFQKNDWIKSIPLDPTKFRFDVEIYVPNPEDVIIAPERVWRDDIFTYIDLGEKSLNMTQRPIVTLIVERIEVPVGFRAKGPNNRLIIVEAVGDMVLRNGKRIVCLKARRSDDVGLENITYADKGEGAFPPKWEVPAPLPDATFGGSAGDSSYKAGQSQDRSGGEFGDGGNFGDYGLTGGVHDASMEAPGSYRASLGGPAGGAGAGSSGSGKGLGMRVPNGAGSDFDYSKMQRISNNGTYSSYSQETTDRYGYGRGFSDAAGANISIELGVDSDVDKLETLWDSLSSKYSEVLGGYEPFFSVDAPADGQGKELFHLRVGPVKSLETGDSVCSRLGRNGVFCSVVRMQ